MALSEGNPICRTLFVVERDYPAAFSWSKKHKEAMQYMLNHRGIELSQG